MIISPKLVAILIVVLLSIATVRAVQGSGLVSATRNGKTAQYDLRDPVRRAKFRSYFQYNIKIAPCFKKADLAVKFLKERDAGTTMKKHLDVVRGLYEKTKEQPRGAVPWSLYIDFERMVRDLHRRKGRDKIGGYAINNPDILWEREFRWCAFR